MKDIYKLLEFDVIKKQIEHYAKTELGLSYIREMQMFDDEDKLIEELLHLDEMMLYIRKYRCINIMPHKDLTTYFNLLKKDGVCGIEFFYQVGQYLENVKNIKNESIKDDNFPFILSCIREMEECENLYNHINHIISKDLEILDSASSSLREIRNQLRQEKSGQSRIINGLLLRYKDYLNDERIALRNSSFVLPVKTSYKNKVNGIVVDESDSGLTCFIEPSEIIASNNKIMRLLEKEKEEIDRILDELSSECRKYVDVLIVNQNIICYFDFLIAKANYSLDGDYLVPRITKEKKISFVNARHPLIDPKKVVKNSYILNEQKIMIITGPNAGGKTVSLKVIGLLVLMGQSGLAIPTSEIGEFSFFKNIFVDMGDNQSLMDNLSTFSGHIKNLVEIVNQISQDSLVILDELGTGTSPLDGEALGIGIIEYLHKTDCFSILTSHYDGLKNYALEKDYILNASMAFDEDNISPTYHLRLGVAGKSYGLELSSRMGLKKDILDVSKAYLEDKRKSSKEITLQLLQHKLEENELIQVSLKEKEEQLNNQLKKLENEKQHLLLLQEKIKEEAEIEKGIIIEQAKKQIDQIYDDFLKKENIKLHEVITTKRNLDLLLDNEEEAEITYVPSIGDYVRADDFNLIGKVVRIKSDNVSILTDQGMSLTVKISQISRIKKSQIKKEKKTFTPSYKLDKKVPLECNVVGYRVEEGLREIDKYIDDAITAHYIEVRLIHGCGTGRLRSAIHEYLKKRKDIKSFRLGGLGEGGVGATIVTLK